ncbi:MAG: LCP family protein [Thermomicrobiales bacterium]
MSTPPPHVGDATVRDVFPTPDSLPGSGQSPQDTSGPAPSVENETQEDVSQQTLPAPDAPAPAANATATTSVLIAADAPLDNEGATATPAGSQSGTLASSEAAPGQSESPLDGEALAEQQLAEGLTFDTAPAVAAIAQYQQQQAGSTGGATGDSTDGARVEAIEQEESDGGIFGSIADKGGELRDAASGAAIAAGLSEPDAEAVTILIMGVDARPGSAIDIGVRPDALMVLRLDPQSGSCRGLAIPRDSYVELPGYGMTKINHALMLGGIPYEQLVVENYLGIDVDHYALIDFTGFASLVDTVGGITIDVPADLTSPAVPAGVQTIDGETALLHARYRGGPDGDFGRIKRQQQIMRGLIAAAKGRDLLTEATRLLTGLQDHIRTDMELSELVSMAESYREICTVEGLTMAQIPGEVVYGPLIDPLFDLPLSYVVSDPAVVAQMVADLEQT